MVKREKSRGPASTASDAGRKGLLRMSGELLTGLPVRSPSAIRRSEDAEAREWRVREEAVGSRGSGRGRDEGLGEVGRSLTEKEEDETRLIP